MLAVCIVLVSVSLTYTLHELAEQKASRERAIASSTRDHRENIRVFTQRLPDFYFTQRHWSRHDADEASAEFIADLEYDFRNYIFYLRKGWPGEELPFRKSYNSKIAPYLTEESFTKELSRSAKLLVNYPTKEAEDRARLEAEEKHRAHMVELDQYWTANRKDFEALRKLEPPVDKAARPSIRDRPEPERGNSPGAMRMGSGSRRPRGA
jgi:hypothetical protein